jgi:excisionase family DNA binding protein
VNKRINQLWSNGPSANHQFEPLLNSEEAAALIKIHPKTLQRMARNGEITGLRIGKLWHFRASSLNDFYLDFARIAEALTCGEFSKQVDFACNVGPSTLVWNYRLPRLAPPSTKRVCPVMNPACSEARNAIAAAISPGCANRPIGTLLK